MEKSFAFYKIVTKQYKYIKSFYYILYPFKERTMSLKKQYLKSKDICKVTFRLPGETTGPAREAFLVGEFNNWNSSQTPMKKLKNGDFTVTINLQKGNQYEFRYLIDGNTWMNDRHADQYIPSPFPYHDNSVVVV